MPAPRCIDAPSTIGGRVALVAIPGGATVSTESAGPDPAKHADGLYEPVGAWSADGSALLVSSFSEGLVVTPDATPSRRWLSADWAARQSPAIPVALDASATRYAAAYESFTVWTGLLADGSQQWTVELPRR
jgi:hypothetical protein